MTARDKTFVSEVVANIVRCETMVNFQTYLHRRFMKTSKCVPYFVLPIPLYLPPVILFPPSYPVPTRPVSSPPRALLHRASMPLLVHPPVLNKQTSSGWLVSPIYNSSQTNYSGDVCQTQENTSLPTSERGREKKKSGGRSDLSHRENESDV